MKRNKTQAKKTICLQSLPLIHPHAAGIDVGAKEHVVAVPADRDCDPVRSFKAFTPDLYELADWLKQCGVETVALESTGIYWITLYEILEERGFQVRVVNARHVKNVPGRTKTDVLDCQWIQKLHSFGLLNGSFRPDHQYSHPSAALCACVKSWWSTPPRAFTACRKHFLRWNVQLSNVISDIVGESGMRILEAILAGERDPAVLAALCNTRIKASRQTVAKSLHGNWREELLFSLRVAMDFYRFTQSKIAECDARIAEHLAQFEDRAALEAPALSLKSELYRICGVDDKNTRHQRASRPDHYFRSRPGHDPVEDRKAVRFFSRSKLGVSVQILTNESNELEGGHGAECSDRICGSLLPCNGQG